MPTEPCLSPGRQSQSTLHSNTGKGALISASEVKGLVDCVLQDLQGSWRRLGDVPFAFYVKPFLLEGTSIVSQYWCGIGDLTLNPCHFPDEVSVGVEISYMCSVHTPGPSGSRELEKWLVWLNNQVEILIPLTFIYIAAAPWPFFSVPLLYTHPHPSMPSSHVNHAARCVSAKACCCSLCAESAWAELPACSTAAVWVRSKLRSSALSLFSRALKAVRHLLSCFRFSRRSQKRGDLKCSASSQVTLSGTPAHRVILQKNGRKVKSWASRIGSISTRVVDSWRRSKGHRLVTLISMQNSLTRSLVQVWGRLLNYTSELLPHPVCEKSVLHTSPPNGWWPSGPLSVQRPLILHKAEATSFLSADISLSSGPCREGKKIRFCQLMKWRNLFNSFMFGAV